MESQVYTINELSEILKISGTTIRDQINKGNIKTIRIGGAIRITQDELNRILKGK